jgi:hypothetical protein
MVRLFNISISSETLTESGQVFSIDQVVGFTVVNHGTADCRVSYENGASPMVVPRGQQRTFGGYSGFIYSGKMKVAFIGKNFGLVEVTKDVVDLKEMK